MEKNRNYTLNINIICSVDLKSELCLLLLNSNDLMLVTIFSWICFNFSNTFYLILNKFTELKIRTGIFYYI